MKSLFVFRLPAVYCLLSVFMLISLGSCDKNGDVPENNPTIADTVAGTYLGRLVQEAYSGPTVTSNTFDNYTVIVHKISADTIHIDRFGQDAYEMYYYNDNDLTDGKTAFSGVGTGVLYSFNASFFVSGDSLHLEAQQHITTGAGNFWRFDGKKQ